MIKPNSIGICEELKHLIITVPEIQDDYIVIEIPELLKWIANVIEQKNS